ncbi:hypothetical protein SAMN04515674_11565 [Pseudarcicella hirudinis]|uniref:2TM domain-containing protein n=1 Tax=Pseudarcicella hirudinis TaxID=1079859 RepID=A0A1I5XMH4_9BACT|nr:hypothetical protein [Pseudarcicella hirudinis]SFQ33139.1 hypothetical protein SAMN04515674_11565 [Pseudarcicella hirudinis]
MKFSRKEVLLLSAGIGFLVIWIIDLNSPTPPEVKNNFWTNIFYHYGWLMFAVGFLFFFQYSKNERLKKEQMERDNPKNPKNDLKSEQRKALRKGKK